MKRILLTAALSLMALMMPLTAAAYSFMVDSIYYDIEGTNAVVTYRWLNKPTYTGNLTIPETVTYNGTTYPVTTIGRTACYLCDELTSVTIPNSVTLIDLDAFRGCSSLASIDIPNTVTQIGGGAFGECSSLTSVFIPATVTKLGVNPFLGCSGLESIIVENGNPNYDTRDNCNAIINTSTNKLISGTKNTVIPNSVTGIDVSAFFGISSLTDIDIPYSVTSIANNAFADCSGLTRFFVPNSVTEIGRYPLQGCTGLESVIVENGNPYYDSRDNCNAIIQTQTNMLISGCKTTIIPSSVTSIGENGFNGISNITSIEIPNSITSIGDRAFEGCTALESIEIPNSVTSLGSYVFYNCTGLTSVTLPNAITEIRSGAFWKCNNLTSITIPNSVTEIGGYAFDTCIKLTSVVIPNSVTKIGGNAFFNCHNLAHVTIGSSVTLIQSYAFFSCANPITVVSLPTTPPRINSNTFDKWAGTIQKGTLYVPAGSLSAYKHAQYWEDLFRYNYELGGIPATSLQLNIISTRMAVGDTLQLRATVSPDEATYKDVTWESSDKKVATVTADGFVTALKSGTVTITATIPPISPDGTSVTASCQIRIRTTPYGPLGDVSGDNDVNISDIILLISYLSQGGAPGFVMDNADYNCDGEVNVSDVTALINSISNE